MFRQRLAHFIGKSAYIAVVQRLWYGCLLVAALSLDFVLLPFDIPCIAGFDFKLVGHVFLIDTGTHTRQGHQAAVVHLRPAEQIEHGDAVSLRVLPAEVLLQPGASVPLRAQLLDANPNVEIVRYWAADKKAARAEAIRLGTDITAHLDERLTDDLNAWGHGARVRQQVRQHAGDHRSPVGTARSRWSSSSWPAALTRSSCSATSRCLRPCSGRSARM